MQIAGFRRKLYFYTSESSECRFGDLEKRKRLQDRTEFYLTEAESCESKKLGNSCLENLNEDQIRGAHPRSSLMTSSLKNFVVCRLFSIATQPRILSLLLYLFFSKICVGTKDQK